MKIMLSKQISWYEPPFKLYLNCNCKKNNLNWSIIDKLAIVLGGSGNGLFFYKFLEDINPFVGSLISLFWTSADVSSGFGNGHVKLLDVHVWLLSTMKEFNNVFNELSTLWRKPYIRYHCSSILNMHWLTLTLFWLNGIQRFSQYTFLFFIILTAVHIPADRVIFNIGPYKYDNWLTVFK